VSHRVLIGTRSFGSTSQEPWRLLAEADCASEVIDITRISDGELAEALVDAEAFIVGKRRITAELISGSPALRIICMHGSGVDHIDLDAAKARGVIVANCPSANSNGVAELTIALMLAIARHVPQSADALRKGEWGRWEGTELRGKVLGLVGLGRIGRRVARLAAGFEMDVLAYDPYMTEADKVDCVALLAGLDELLARGDIVSLHVPATDETFHLMNKRTLSLMKPHAYLINTARGELIDETALIEALAAKRIEGAALDVFAHEPPGDSPLLTMPNIVATPHIGAHSIEAITAASVTCVRNVVQALETGEPLFRVV